MSIENNPLVVTGSLAYDHLSTYENRFSDVLIPEKLNALSVCFVVSDKKRYFGGTAGNIAYNFTLLGEKPLIVGAAGYDFSEYETYLINLGLSTTGIKISQELPTASATIITDVEGHQIAEFHAGAMGNGKKPTIEPLKKASLILIAADDPHWMMEYAQTAKNHQIPYFFDPGQAIHRFSEEQLKEVVESAKGIFLNEYEGELLKKIMGKELQEIQNPDQIWIITHGPKGSEIFYQDKQIHVPIATAHRILDPTGCGDAYRTGFLKGYLQNKELEICGKMGALMATYALEHKGTQKHHFHWNEFQQRYGDSFNTRL